MIGELYRQSDSQSESKTLEISSKSPSRYANEFASPKLTIPCMWYFRLWRYGNLDSSWRVVGTDTRSSWKNRRELDFPREIIGVGGRRCVQWITRVINFNTRVRDVTLCLLRPPAFRSARAQLASTAERKTGRKVNPAPPQAQRALDANGQPSRLSYQFFGACIPAEQPPHEDNKTEVGHDEFPTISPNRRGWLGRLLYIHRYPRQ
ncbi:hypothetical protein PSTG_12308 [Puccinia striiformis f. sp. tritici PST-78]|uniref:Uncharacterized protein n=1 Tax=Puccinia striiformis f. sp. tritici PST-78 TaxID=1165861 RepID=A0A0L0V4S2_9BASI|nr:hypothetical protein PSTG_12308 [Puccinia striiformis f. sp. tritici PST-78]